MLCDDLNTAAILTFGDASQQVHFLCVRVCEIEGRCTHVKMHGQTWVARHTICARRAHVNSQRREAAAPQACTCIPRRSKTDVPLPCPCGVSAQAAWLAKLVLSQRCTYTISPPPPPPPQKRLTRTSRPARQCTYSAVRAHRWRAVLQQRPPVVAPPPLLPRSSKHCSTQPVYGLQHTASVCVQHTAVTVSSYFHIYTLSPYENKKRNRTK